MDYINYLRSMVGHEKVIMVAVGAMVFNEKEELLLQLRSDSRSWGIPGGFMELNESVRETAKREVFEETGITMGELSLFGIYSGPSRDKTFSNGDQAALVEVFFKCTDYSGKFIEQNEETLENRFFPLTDLPDNLFIEHLPVINDLLSEKKIPVVG
ncbi:NUDIX domain-containing protein [Metabacillus indicus]|uniref:NUDIX hydrolase n=1 Tax=Metabacillus indicus TaxID=246786 RepID=UPI003171B9EB